MAKALRGKWQVGTFLWPSSSLLNVCTLKISCGLPLGSGRLVLAPDVTCCTRSLWFSFDCWIIIRCITALVSPALTLSLSVMEGLATQTWICILVKCRLIQQVWWGLRSCNSNQPPWWCWYLQSRDHTWSHKVLRSPDYPPFRCCHFWKRSQSKVMKHLTVVRGLQSRTITVKLHRGYLLLFHCVCAF